MHLPSPDIESNGGGELDGAEIGEMFGELVGVPSLSRELSIFSIAGRGYYENPASDLLAFFLEPQGMHGLGVLFLEAIFDCIDGGTESSLSNMVTVEREVPTGKGRLDLWISGKEWVMMIENKIGHWLANPFDDYDRYAKEESKGRQIFSIVLSPSKVTTAGWQGVSYGEFHDRLKERLSSASVNFVAPRWRILVEEFLLLIRCETMEQQMDQKQIEFVEKHQAAIEQVKELSMAYRDYLLRCFKDRLLREFPSSDISVWDVGWGIRCRLSHWGEPDVVWCNKSGTSEGELRVYLAHVSDDQRSAAAHVFGDEWRMRHWSETYRRVRWDCWETTDLSVDRSEAADQLVLLAQAMNRIIPLEPTSAAVPG